MIGIQEQDELLELLSSNIEEDTSCYAFGGTALMYQGFKESTKDIDLIFKTEKDRQIFINALLELDFKKISLIGIYIKNKLKDKNKPEIYERGDVRFDLFVENIFRTKLTDSMRERSKEKHDFIRKDKTLTVFVISPEDIILLKSVTNRENDFADIKMILKKKDIDWNIIVNEAVKQKEKWTILDLEEKMRKLKKKFYIPKKYFDMLYKSL